MIQMASPRESQLLLQTCDIIKRLEAQKTILIQASDIIGEQATKAGVVNDVVREEIKRTSFTDDYDEDILPKHELNESAEVEKDEWDISNIE